MNIKVHLAEWLIKFDKKVKKTHEKQLPRNIYYRLY